MTDAKNSKSNDTSASQTDQGSGDTTDTSSMSVTDMIAKATSLKASFSKAQSDITTMEGHGSAASGKVTVVCDGTGALKAVKIDPSMMAGDAAVLEELIVKAATDAKTDARTESGKKIKETLQQLPIPGAIVGLIADYLGPR